MDEPCGPQAQQVERRLAHELGPELHQPAEIEALHTDVAADEVRGIDLWPRPAREADPDHDPEREDEAERVGEQLPADRVEHDVHGLELAEAVVGDGLGCSEREGQLELRLRAGRRNDLGPQCDCHLHGGAADAAGSRVDEHPCAAAYGRLPREREPRGQERRQEPGPLLERRGGRQVEQPLPVHRSTLGIAAAGRRQQPEHPAATLGLTRDLVPRDPRQCGRLRIEAAPDERVGEVDPCSPHDHELLPILGHRLRRVPEVERLGSAHRLLHDRAHGSR